MYHAYTVDKHIISAKMGLGREIGEVTQGELCNATYSVNMKIDNRETKCFLNSVISLSLQLLYLSFLKLPCSMKPYTVWCIKIICLFCPHTVHLDMSSQSL